MASPEEGHHVVGVENESQRNIAEADATRPGNLDVWQRVAALVLIAGVAVWLAHTYYGGSRFVDPAGTRLVTHEGVLDGTADAPYRYRLLVPLLVHPFVAGAVADRDYTAFDLRYGYFYFLTFFAFLLSMWYLLRHWFEVGPALAGVFLVGSLLPVALRPAYFQPWSWPEPAFVALAITAVVRRAPLWAFSLLALCATLNRETGILVALVALGGAVRFRGSRHSVDRQMAAAAAVAAVTWAAVFLGLRVVRGSAPNVLVPSEIWERNTEPGALWLAERNAALLLLAVAVVAVIGFVRGRVPRPIGMMVLVAAPPYLVSVLVWGIWSEVRLLVPLFPLLIPAALAAVSDARGAPNEGART